MFTVIYKEVNFQNMVLLFEPPSGVCSKVFSATKVFYLHVHLQQIEQTDQLFDILISEFKTINNTGNINHKEITSR